MAARCCACNGCLPALKKVSPAPQVCLKKENAPRATMLPRLINPVALQRARATPIPANQSAVPSSSDLPSLDSIFSTRVYTLPHIPNGARDAWAGMLARELTSVCSSPQDLDSWSRLMMLPSSMPLWDAVTTESEKLSFSQSISNNSSTSKVRRAKRALEDGKFRKAIQALSSRVLTL